MILLLLLPVHLSGQDNKAVTINGYVNTMQSVTFDSLKGPFINDNLIHNRLNFKWYASNSFTMAADFRNRLFTGDMVRTGSLFSDQVGYDPGWLDMSWNIASGESYLFNTAIDRLWLDYRSGKIQITLGRQRINWGQTFVWNPNDLFNTYSYFDVDYPERPGSDAVRIQFYPSYSSAAEMVVKVDNEGDITAAALYRFNKLGYDLQFLGGYFNSEDIVLGTGWSGAIGSMSFRGEATMFQPWGDFPLKDGVVVFTTGLEKIFADNSMAQLQLMYCNSPVEVENFASFYYGDLSAKTLAFSEFTAFGQFTWAVSPLVNLGIALMWMPDLKGYFAGPSLDYSIAGNVDFSLFWQYFSSTASGSREKINLGFMRIKYSF